jgi:hypothetical protein
MINYVIGCYWEDEEGSICTYEYHGEVQYGSKDDADEFLEYVKKQEPEKNWQIFILRELQ